MAKTNVTFTVWITMEVDLPEDKNVADLSVEIKPDAVSVMSVVVGDITPVPAVFVQSDVTGVEEDEDA